MKTKNEINIKIKCQPRMIKCSTYVTDMILASCSLGQLIIFDFYNIQLLIVNTLTLTLTMHNFFRLFLSPYIIRSFIFGRIRIRVQLLFNCVGWLPSVVAECVARSSLTHTIQQQLYSNSHYNKNLQHRAIIAPVGSSLDSYKLLTP